ncbi:MAG TPA: hypothetical protein VHB30_10475 [Solirubrobacteraceae bacterium]|nr:hypothetical protein [Solirubrobacteraceae bacterium]
MRRLALGLLLALCLTPVAAATAAGLPRTFFGAMADGPLDDPAVLLREGAVMDAAGVGTIRLQFNWALIEPQRGRPDFATMDRRVAAAARDRLDVLGLVLDSPGWAAEVQGRDMAAPRRPADYAAFLRRLIARYGPDGTFWKANPGLPRVPVRAWEIWNEPNLSDYWSARPYASSYRELLCAAYRAAKAADRGSTVVMAGLANDSWRAMAALEKAGVHGCFDVAAVHPFSGRPSNSLKITRLNREALDRGGDAGKPIWLTELTWPSALGKTKNTHGWEVTPAGQAQRLTEAYTLYVRDAKALRLRRIYWYTWASYDRDSPNSFVWSGLRVSRPDGTIADKPAMRALRAIVRRYGTS